MTTSAHSKDLDLLGVGDVADLADVARRTVEDWIARGWLVPEATVARRLLWRRRTIRSWNAVGRPRLDGSGRSIAGEKFEAVTASSIEAVVRDAGLEPLPELVGTDYVADATGRKQRTIFQWNAGGKLPAVDFEVSFSALIWRRETIDRWLEECSTVAAATG